MDASQGTIRGAGEADWLTLTGEWRTFYWMQGSESHTRFIMDAPLWRLMQRWLFPEGLGLHEGFHPVPMQQLGYACTEHIKLDSKK